MSSECEIAADDPSSTAPAPLVLTDGHDGRRPSSPDGGGSNSGNYGYPQQNSGGDEQPEAARTVLQGLYKIRHQRMIIAR